MLRLRFAALSMTRKEAIAAVMLSAAKHLLPKKPAVRNVSYLHDTAQKFSALQPGQQVVHRPLGHDLARLVRCAA